jgi:hypothetical protein
MCCMCNGESTVRDARDQVNNLIEAVEGGAGQASRSRTARGTAVNFALERRGLSSVQCALQFFQPLVDVRPSTLLRGYLLLERCFFRLQ